MAILTIPNQPIFFDVVESCLCITSDKCILVDQTDDSSFQVQLTESTGTDLVTDGGFATACGGGNWVCGAAWGIATGTATYTAGGANSMEQDIGTLAINTYYKVSFDIVSETTAQFDVLLGGNNIAASILATVATFTVYYYMTATTDDLILVTGNSGTFQIDNLSVKVMSSPNFSITPVSEPTSYTYVRDAISRTTPATMTANSLTRLRDTGILDIHLINDIAQFNLDWSGASLNDGCYHIELDDDEIPDLKGSWCFDLQTFTCTKLLSWTNDEGAFGFDFSTNISGTVFTPTMRIECLVRKARYLNDEEVFRFSDGESRLLYADSLKIFEFESQYLTEEMHDALRVGMLHDTFTIDSTGYVKQEGDYSPNWDKGADAPVTVDLIPKTQKTENSYC